jgi:hypothetical protein
LEKGGETALINPTQMIRGVAFYQIAIHSKFTSINKLDLYESRSAFLINNDIGKYLKHAKETTTVRNECRFGFSWDERYNIDKLADEYPKTFVVLICAEDRGICCLDYKFDLLPLLEEKDDSTDETSTLYVKPESGKGFFINMFQKGSSTKLILPQPGKEIPRNAFPNILFE